MSPEETLKDSAEKLSHADPQEYERFARALDAYVFQVTVAVSECGNEDILRYQGRSQQARKLLNLFTEFLS